LEGLLVPGGEHFVFELSQMLAGHGYRRLSIIRYIRAIPYTAATAMLNTKTLKAENRSRQPRNHPRRRFMPISITAPAIAP
jgi:hypothetical protein